MTLKLHRPDGDGGLKPRPAPEETWRDELRSPRWGSGLRGGRLPQLRNPEMNPTSTLRSVLFWLAGRPDVRPPGVPATGRGSGGRSSVQPDPVLVVGIVDRRRDEQDLGRILELPPVWGVGRDHPDVALLDRPGDAADGDRAGSLEDVPDLVVGHVDVRAERPRMALEDEDARLCPVTQVRALEDVGVGRACRPSPPRRHRSRRSWRAPRPADT